MSMRILPNLLLAPCNVQNPSVTCTVGMDPVCWDLLHWVPWCRAVSVKRDGHLLPRPLSMAMSQKIIAWSLSVLPPAISMGLVLPQMSVSVMLDGGPFHSKLPVLPLNAMQIVVHMAIVLLPTFVNVRVVGWVITAMKPDAMLPVTSMAAVWPQISASVRRAGRDLLVHRHSVRSPASMETVWLLIPVVVVKATLVQTVPNLAVDPRVCMEPVKSVQWLGRVLSVSVVMVGEVSAAMNG